MDTTPTARYQFTGDMWSYYHHDARGNVIMLTDQAGDLVEQYDYQAFGTVQVKERKGSVPRSDKKAQKGSVWACIDFSDSEERKGAVPRIDNGYNPRRHALVDGGRESSGRENRGQS